MSSAIKSLTKFSFLTFALLASSFLSPGFASAQCACARPNITALEEYAAATVVFTGEIVEIQESERDKDNRYIETAKIAVDRAWKKDVESVVRIKNIVLGCVQGWKKGDRYLVYAYQNDDKITYSTGCCCSRTGQLEKTAGDISDFLKAGYRQSNVLPRTFIAGWMNSRATNFLAPDYPAAITRNRRAARVDVRILTDVDGSVISAEIIRGPAEFHAAAIEAAKRLKFPPTQLEGLPAKVAGWVSYDFKP